ncbi:MAG TPA: response regulator [Gemmatimonadaceae bacterium]|jgi:two-component system LytT family response regulator
MLDEVRVHALIADDEPLARRGIRQLLAPHHDVDVVGEARNGRETVHLARTLRPDLLFLDVQMPELDAFGVLRALTPSPLPAVIFVTAYDHFAVRAFESHALDYLVKPIEEARFVEALQRTRDRMRSLAAVELSHRLAALLSPRERASLTRGLCPTRLVVPTSAGELVLEAEEIDWIEADDYYAAIHARGRRHLMRQSLAVLERRLDPEQFVRAHRGAIVNIERVRELRGDAGETVLLLRDGTRVPVSRRRREHVTRRIRVLGGEPFAAH